MVRVVGIDHISLRVGDYRRSKAFYGKLMPFLGFKVLDDKLKNGRCPKCRKPLPGPLV